MTDCRSLLLAEGILFFHRIMRDSDNNTGMSAHGPPESHSDPKKCYYFFP